ncbi:hypothetical protein KSP40_PGU002378 [Platanthera guangdongensis]|uniref:Uncharacterized protein n=1 Tax=Platanthera guangdongensis TaxID=2320717 RepID=A0ABR2LHQ5_9ASPA
MADSSKKQCTELDVGEAENGENPFDGKQGSDENAATDGGDDIGVEADDGDHHNNNYDNGDDDYGNGDDYYANDDDYLYNEGDDYADYD